MTGTIAPDLARRHEALSVRLDALLRELAPMARKRPEHRVPPAVQASAERMLFAARSFGVTAPLPGKGRAVAAETWAGVIAALAEARAQIETFETTHSLWDQALQCRAWRIAEGEPLPIGRLRFAGKAQPGSRASAAESEGLRRKVAGRLDELIVAAYQQGFADASEGRPAAPHAVTLAAREEQLNQG